MESSSRPHRRPATPALATVETRQLHSQRELSPQNRQLMPSAHQISPTAPAAALPKPRIAAELHLISLPSSTNFQSQQPRQPQDPQPPDPLLENSGKQIQKCLGGESEVSAAYG